MTHFTPEERRRLWPQVERVIDVVVVPALARIDPPGTPARLCRVQPAQREHVRLVLRAVAALQLTSGEPTIGRLAHMSDLGRKRVNRVYEICRLDALPALTHLVAIELGEHAEPDVIYLKSWVDSGWGPDKYGAMSLVPPAIPAAQKLHVPTGSRNAPSATSVGYAIAVADDIPFALAQQPLAQGWWNPANWEVHLDGTDLDPFEVEAQLREHAGHHDWDIPLVTDPRGMADGLLGGIVAAREQAGGGDLRLRDSWIGSGWVQSGMSVRGAPGEGSQLEFVASDLDSIWAVADASFVPMLDLPQDAASMRGRLRPPRPRWELDWEFLLDGAVRSSDAVFSDLIAAAEGGGSASRWWSPFEPAAVRAIGASDRTRCCHLRCRVRAPGHEAFRSLTFVAVARFDRGGVRWSGWVTTADPDPVRSDAGARLDAQVAILRTAEGDVRHHSRDGVVERLRSHLLEAGWAQRVRRRKYQERANAAALAMTASTVIQLARLRV